MAIVRLPVGDQVKSDAGAAVWPQVVKVRVEPVDEPQELSVFTYHECGLELSARPVIWHEVVVRFWQAAYGTLSR